MKTDSLGYPFTSLKVFALKQDNCTYTEDSSYQMLLIVDSDLKLNCWEQWGIEDTSQTTEKGNLRDLSTEHLIKDGCLLQWDDY